MKRLNRYVHPSHATLYYSPASKSVICAHCRIHMDTSAADYRTRACSYVVTTKAIYPWEVCVAFRTPAEESDHYTCDPLGWTLFSDMADTPKFPSVPPGAAPPCVCDIRDLMTNGHAATCGYAKRSKPRLTEVSDGLSYLETYVAY